MGLTEIAAEEQADAQGAGMKVSLFERMNALLDSMNAKLKQDRPIPFDIDAFLETYTGEREQLSEWEQEFIDRRFNTMSNRGKCKDYFGEGVHYGPGEYDCFTR